MSKLILALDSQALSTFKLCPRKYFLNFESNLETLKKSPALNTGTLVHKILAHYYRARASEREFTKQQLLQIGQKVVMRSALTQEEKFFHIRKFCEYVSTEKPHFVPLGVEKGFSKILYEDNYTLFVYEGRIDLVGTYANTLCWMDHKSQSREYALYKNTDQFLGYSWAIGSTLGFINYYGLQESKKANECFHVETIYHQRELISQWRLEAIQTFREIAGRARDMKYFQRNRSACNAGKFGDCQFLRLCDNEWAGGEILNGLVKIHYKERDKKWKAW